MSCLNAVLPTYKDWLPLDIIDILDSGLMDRAGWFVSDDMAGGEGRYPGSQGQGFLKSGVGQIRELRAPIPRD